jgi:hypothetical protein
MLGFLPKRKHYLSLVLQTRKDKCGYGPCVNTKATCECNCGNFVFCDNGGCKHEAKHATCTLKRDNKCVNCNDKQATTGIYTGCNRCYRGLALCTDCQLLEDHTNCVEWRDDQCKSITLPKHFNQAYRCNHCQRLTKESITCATCWNAQYCGLFCQRRQAARHDEECNDKRKWIQARASQRTQSNNRKQEQEKAANYAKKGENTASDTSPQEKSNAKEKESTTFMDSNTSSNENTLPNEIQGDWLSGNVHLYKSNLQSSNMVSIMAWNCDGLTTYKFSAILERNPDVMLLTEIQILQNSTKQDILTQIIKKSGYKVIWNLLTEDDIKFNHALDLFDDYIQEKEQFMPPLKIQPQGGSAIVIRESLTKQGQPLFYLENDIIRDPSTRFTSVRTSSRIELVAAYGQADRQNRKQLLTYAKNELETSYIMPPEMFVKKLENFYNSPFTIVGGDFNLNDKKEHTDSAKSGKGRLTPVDKLFIQLCEKKKFINILEEMTLNTNEWIDSPCTTKHSTWIDKFFCHEYLWKRQGIAAAGVDTELFNSDHYPIYISLDLDKIDLNPVQQTITRQATPNKDHIIQALLQEAEKIANVTQGEVNQEFVNTFTAGFQKILLETATEISKDCPPPILDPTKLKKPQRKLDQLIAALTGMISAFKQLCNFPLRKNTFNRSDLITLQLYKITQAVWTTHRARVDEAFKQANIKDAPFPMFNRKKWEDYTPVLAFDVQQWLKHAIPLHKSLKKQSKQLKEEIEQQAWISATNKILHKGYDYKKTLEKLDAFLEKEKKRAENKKKGNYFIKPYNLFEAKDRHQQKAANRPKRRNEIEEKLTKFWEKVHQERAKPKDWELPQEWEVITQNEIQARKGRNAEKLIEPITMNFLTWWVQNKLKLKTSPGKDKIPNEVYKFLFSRNKDEKVERNFNKIRQHILNVFNLLLQGYQLPDDWHIAHITCAFKGGNIKEPAHYRPIALLINLYKIFSGILTFRLSTYTETNQLICEAQAGSRPAHGVHELISALISIMNGAITTKSPLYILFIDIKKAYNSVPHWALFQRLEAIGCPQQFVTVIKNIYTQCDSFVKVNGVIAKTGFREQRGVRQGDPLSPLLWIIFLDPLIRSVRAKSVQELNTNSSSRFFDSFIGGQQVRSLLKLANLAYVDDLAFGAGTQNQLKIQTTAISQFFNFYALEVGIDDKSKTKTAIMEVGDSPSLTEVITLNTGNNTQAIPILAKDESYKYLGIHFQYNLDWNIEIKAIKKKLNHACRIFHLEKNIPVKYVQYAVNSIILPIVDYRSRVIAFEKKVLTDFRKIIFKAVNKQLEFFDELPFEVYCGDEGHLFQPMGLMNPVDTTQCNLIVGMINQVVNKPGPGAQATQIICDLDALLAPNNLPLPILALDRPDDFVTILMQPTQLQEAAKQLSIQVVKIFDTNLLITDFEGWKRCEQTNFYPLEILTNPECTVPLSLIQGSCHSNIFPTEPYEAENVTAIFFEESLEVRVDVGIDGGFFPATGDKKAKAVSAVFFGEKSKHNLARSCWGDNQDLNSFVAETQAALEALLHLPTQVRKEEKVYDVTQVHIWIDNEAVAKIITNPEAPEPHSFLEAEFKRIKALLTRYENLDITIEWHWIPSHIDQKQKNEPKWFEIDYLNCCWRFNLTCKMSKQKISFALILILLNI